MSMTIKEFLEISKGKNVRIGFHQAYIYCDYVTDDTAYIIESMSKVYEIETNAKIKKLKEDIKELKDDSWIRKYKSDENLKISNLNKRIENLKIKKPEGYLVKIELAENKLKNIIKFSKKRFNQKRRDRLRTLNNKKQQINNLKDSLNKFVPYLECTCRDMYPSTTDDSIIFVCNENKHINGKYWDRNDYINRHKKRKNYESIAEVYTVDSLLQFFASDYGQLLCGNVEPEFIIKEMLDAKLYLVY